jgi:hypothetical protein
MKRVLKYFKQYSWMFWFVGSSCIFLPFDIFDWKILLVYIPTVILVLISNDFYSKECVIKLALPPNPFKVNKNEWNYYNEEFIPSNETYTTKDAALVAYNRYVYRMGQLKG